MNLFKKNPPPPGKERQRVLLTGIEPNIRLWSFSYQNLRKEKEFEWMEKAWILSLGFFIFIHYRYLVDEGTEVNYEV